MIWDHQERAGGPAGRTNVRPPHSMPPSGATFTTCKVRPRAFAAASASFTSISVFGLSRAANMPIGAIPGTRLDRSSSLFATSLLERKVTPVTFAPGRLKLATRPNSTGLTPVTKTIGMLAVAALAAIAGGVVFAKTTLTFNRTSSSASVGRRSLWPSAKRCSIVRFRPTTKPASFWPSLMAVIGGTPKPVFDYAEYRSLDSLFAAHPRRAITRPPFQQ